MAKKKKADIPVHEAAAMLGDHMRVSDDAVVMAAVGGASFIQVTMAMTPQQRMAVVIALQQMIRLVEEMDNDGTKFLRYAPQER